MAEKLLITQALDERDLLNKRIRKAIDTSLFVAAVREKDEKINGVDIAKIESDALANWNSITDMIDRYDRITKAIIQSNATLTIKFSDGTEMTKAEAIAKKSIYKEGHSFVDILMTTVSRQHKAAVLNYDKYDQSYTTMRQEFMNNLLTAEKAKSLNEEQIASVDTMAKPYVAKMIDPLNVVDKMNTAKDKIDTFLSEVDTLIKVSNATEYVEF